MPFRIHFRNLKMHLDNAMAMKITIDAQSVLLYTIMFITFSTGRGALQYGMLLVQDPPFGLAPIGTLFFWITVLLLTLWFSEISLFWLQISWIIYHILLSLLRLHNVTLLYFYRSIPVMHNETVVIFSLGIYIDPSWNRVSWS